jgi:3-oxoacyl-[acyl-carrier-protein] synthase-1
VRPEALERRREAGILKSDDHPQGILPGEGAAFVVLEREAPPGVRARGRVHGTGVAEEPTVDTDAPNAGVGLTRALRAARAAAGGADFATFPRVVCDLNGDRYRAMEWAYVLVRALSDLKDPAPGPGQTERWHPAECTGDMGAASGVVNLVWAQTAMARGYAGSDRALVWGASDGPLRAAAVLGA